MTAPAILSPYPIPETLRTRKTPNIGDGFILRAIERLLRIRFGDRVLSPRVAPTPAGLQGLLDARCVILGGANQLNDRYTVWPGLDADRLRELDLVLIPMGIGLHGEPGHNDAMSEATREILRTLHARIEFSSWRCPDTVAYLRRELPELADKTLMTGCPVMYDKPILDGKPFGDQERSIAVTATERGDFMARELATLETVAGRFPRARRLFVVHQNFSPPSRFERLRHALGRRRPDDRVAELRACARRLGYRIVLPRDADEALAIYRDVDMHCGSRLHAHLLFLSQAKRSALVPVDGRATGIATHFDFPLCTPERLPAALELNFEPVRERIIRTFETMRRFLQSVENRCSP
ncbi:MAG: polysaccharide pyruvyl transferase family protein [Burkholderiaceae bacterium]